MTDEQVLGEKLLVVGHVMKWSREKDFLKVTSCLIFPPLSAVATFLCHFREFIRCLASFTHIFRCMIQLGQTVFLFKNQSISLLPECGDIVGGYMMVPQSASRSLHY